MTHEGSQKINGYNQRIRVSLRLLNNDSVFLPFAKSVIDENYNTTKQPPGGIAKRHRDYCANQFGCDKEVYLTEHNERNEHNDRRCSSVASAAQRTGINLIDD